MRLHPVQVSMPRDEEDKALQFYGEALGLTEVEKPAELAKRGGCWFRNYDASGAVTAEIHLGVEQDFIPAEKAHPALVLDSIAQLDALGTHISDAGFNVNWSERRTFDGFWHGC